jgi:hypothetical protein
VNSYESLRLSVEPIGWVGFMGKRPPNKVAADLIRIVARARESLLDAANQWLRLRHRYLVRKGVQPRPEPSSKQKVPKDSEK